jgi:hypothetical protein
MKKFLSAITTLALTLLSFATLSVLSLAPASADIPDNISYCQATASDTNPFVLIKNAPLKSLINDDGTFKQGGINAGDKVGPFTWDFGGNSHGSFPGQNWDSTLDPNFLTVHDCNSTKHDPLLTPSVSFTPATCADRDGAVHIGTLPANVFETTTLTNKTWTVDFTKTADTIYHTYVWDAAAVLHHTFTITDPITDPLWDTKLGDCRMPNMGAGLSETALIYGGGFFALGALLLFGLAITKRRSA